MLSGDENETKPVRKSARKGKADQDGRKAEPRKRKSTPRQDPQSEQVLEASEAISTPVTAAENSLTDVLSDVLSGEVSPAAPVTAAEAVEAPNAPAEQLLEAAEAIGTAVMSNETVVTETSLAESSSVVPAETVPVSYQTIADEYRRYTTESLDRTQTFSDGLPACGRSTRLSSCRANLPGRPMTASSRSRERSASCTASWPGSGCSNGKASSPA